MLISKMSGLLSKPESEELASTPISQEPPLPTESEIENMLDEIRQLEQEEIQSASDNESKQADGQNNELSNI